MFHACPWAHGQPEYFVLSTGPLLQGHAPFLQNLPIGPCAAGVRLCPVKVEHAMCRVSLNSALLLVALRKSL